MNLTFWRNPRVQPWTKTKQKHFYVSTILDRLRFVCVCVRERERERERERLEGNPFVDRPKTKMEVLEFRLEEREKDKGFTINWI